METEEKTDRTSYFENSLATSMAIVSSAVVLPGVILAWIIGGGKGLVGALIGFGLAGAYSFVVFWTLRWVVHKPPTMLTSLMMASYIVRLVALVAIFYGLHFIKWLDMLAILSCFLALYVADTFVEMIYASRAFGAMLRKKSPGQDTKV